jgi:carbamoyl-phosphate synthase large subunit
MKSLNVLITGAGGAAAVAFYEAVKSSDHQFFMADMNENSVGFYLVDVTNRCLLKSSSDIDFIQHLFNTCRENKIDIIIPTVDSELLAIAKNKSLFSDFGISVISSDYDSLAMVLDKYKLMQQLQSNFNLAWFAKYDDKINPKTLNYPCLIKPRCDSGSRGIKIINNSDDLQGIPTNSQYMLQDYLPDKEYSVDVYLDQDHKAVASVVRERIKTYGGVAVISKTIKWPLLSELAAKMSEFLKLRYAVNVQFKLDDKGVPCLLEINPRFPGTSSLTVAAGVNMPNLCLQEAAGGKIRAHYFYQELAMVRRWQETFIPPTELHTHLDTSVA